MASPDKIFGNIRKGLSTYPRSHEQLIIMPLLFFALWPDEFLQQPLATLAQTLRAQCGAKLVDEKNIHLTLAFLGEVDASNIARMIEAAATIKLKSFPLQLNQLGSFHRSKVAWIAPTETPPELLSLVSDLHDKLRAENFTFDTKPFVPHITLLRKTHSLETTKLEKAISWNVRAFALVRSYSEERGVRYEVIRKFL